LPACCYKVPEPACLYDQSSRPEERGLYHQQYWPKLLDKWTGLVPLPKVFDPAQPLGRWRRTAQEAYKISLPLPGNAKTKTKQPKDKPHVTESLPLEAS
jgi:hypothetical protein